MFRTRDKARPTLRFFSEKPYRIDYVIQLC